MLDKKLTMIALVLATLTLSVHGQSSSQCSCSTPQSSDGVCPKTTAIAAERNKNQLWEDSDGNARKPTANKCCQIKADKDVTANKGDVCSPDSFKCPSFPNLVNPLVCSQIPNSDDFVCVCATQGEYDKAVSSAVLSMIVQLLVGVIMFLFAVVYIWHWYGCAIQYDGCCVSSNKGNGCSMACCNFRKHCFGRGADVKTWLYYIFCCPCRCGYGGCNGREKLKEYEKDMCCARTDSEPKLSPAVTGGAPPVFEMVA